MTFMLKHTHKHTQPISVHVRVCLCVCVRVFGFVHEMPSVDAADADFETASRAVSQARMI